MDLENIVVVVALIVIFIALLFSAFLFFNPTKPKISNRLFALFLLLVALDVTGIFSSLIFGGPSNLAMLRNNLIFIQLPVFYLYVLSVCYSDFQLKLKYAWHFLPFLLINLILVPSFYAVGATDKILFFEFSSTQWELKVITAVLHIQTFSYLGYILILLKKNKRLYLENFSAAHVKSYEWLFQATLALTIFYVLAFFKNIIRLTDQDFILTLLNSALLVFELITVCWYLLKALNHPTLFRNFDSTLQLAKTLIPEERRKELPAQLMPEDQKVIMQLKAFIESEKPFLNPSLTIKDLANHLQLPARDLSVLINHKLGKHFFDFINEYRIKAAQSILEDASKSKVTVLEILFEVGFNSKSSFNTAFKKHTGTTPTSFRKQLTNNKL